MPWQPFRRKNKYRHVGERGAEEETSFDTELLPRSVSDGNLVRCGDKYSGREALPHFGLLLPWLAFSFHLQLHSTILRYDKAATKAFSSM